MVTKFYFHQALNSESNLPTTEQSTATLDINADAVTVNRSMTTTIGVAQQTLGADNPGATVSDAYYTRFVSEPLNQSSIAANTWTYNFAAQESASGDNFPVTSTDKAVRVNCYVWRPGTGKIGTILDGGTAATVDEGAPSTEIAHHVTFTGSAVAGMVDGDVICFEVWFLALNNTNRGTVTGFWYYDGTTENTTDNATVSNHASFLSTPEDLTFSGGPPPETAIERNRFNYTNINKVGFMDDVIRI